MITIHRARLTEVAAIKKVLSETWIDTYGQIYLPKTIETITSQWHHPEQLSKQIQDPEFYFGVAKDREEIIGLTTVKRLDDSTLIMGRLYIQSSHQRQGIGARLMKEAISAFPGIKRLRVEVEEQNQKGIAFYKRHGFKEIGRKTETVAGQQMSSIEMEKEI